MLKHSAQVNALIRSANVRLTPARVKMAAGGQHFGGISPAGKSGANGAAAPPASGTAGESVTQGAQASPAGANKSASQGSSSEAALRVLNKNFLRDFKGGVLSTKTIGAWTTDTTSKSSKAHTQTTMTALTPEKRRAIALEGQQRGHVEETNKRARYTSMTADADPPTNGSTRNGTADASIGNAAFTAAMLSTPTVQQATPDLASEVRQTPPQTQATPPESSNSPRIPYTSTRSDRIAVVPSSDTEEEDENDIQEIERMAKQQREAEELRLYMLREANRPAIRRDDIEEEESNHTAMVAPSFSNDRSIQRVSDVPIVSRQHFRKAIYHLQFFHPSVASARFAAQHYYLPHKETYLATTTSQSSALLCSSSALRLYKTRLAHRRAHKLDRGKDAYLDFEAWESRKLAAEAKVLSHEAAARLARSARA